MKPIQKSFGRDAIHGLCCAVVVTGLACIPARAQVNSGSNGSDGAFNPSVDTVLDMASHPDGIYQYTSVNIPKNVTVSFKPNTRNAPVIWLIQSTCVIDGTVSASGQDASSTQIGAGGPGGWGGGSGGTVPSTGQGPGGGAAVYGWAANGTYTYGNPFLVPLLGGSGGGGTSRGDTFGESNGGGGGGVILIAASNRISLDGFIYVHGGNGYYTGGGGSGGAVRLYSAIISGSGVVDVTGGRGISDFGDPASGGTGRVRLDTFEDAFTGQIIINSGYNISRGFQPIIFPADSTARLTVGTVGGAPISASPMGVLSTPDTVLSAQQPNPVSIVVQCINLPLNTAITVSVKPMNGSPVSAVGYNTGTFSSSTATVSINIPRGGGLIYATAATSN